MSKKRSIFHRADCFASKIRRELGLGFTPIDNIFKILLDAKIFIVKIPIEGGNLSGCFFYDVKTDQVWILINSARTQGHQRFTAAHEFCHFLKDKALSFIVCEGLETEDKPVHEKFADQFAASFLLPKDAVLKHFSKGKIINPNTIVKICLKYKVSYMSALWRVKSLGLISEIERAELSIASPVSIAESLGAGTEDPENPFIVPTEKHPLERISREYLNLAVSLFKDGKISKGKLAEYIDGDLNDVDNLLRKDS